MVIMKVINANGNELPLFDGIEYQVGDVIRLREQPGFAYKVISREFITSQSSGAITNTPPEVHVILYVQKGKMVTKDA